MAFMDQLDSWEAIQQEKKDAWIAYTQDPDNNESWERWNRAWKAYFGKLHERLEATGEWAERASQNAPLEWDENENNHAL